MGSSILYDLGVAKRHLFKGPILEVGSKDYGNTTGFRSLFPGEPYFGIDMEAGDGVDELLDLTDSPETVERTLKGQRFQTVICISVMEHCANPFKMAENIQRLLLPGGVLFVSVPFSWRLHGYPNDYWRFTPAAIRLLFSEIQFHDEHSCITTTWPGEIYPIDGEPRVEFDTTKGISKGQYGPVMAWIIKLVWRYQLLPWLVRWPYLHPPTSINMIGTRC